ncbi:MAG: endonuclease III [Acidimicrobiales bacterium]
MAKPRSTAGRARVVLERLAAQYPGDAATLCALRHDGAFQLLVATILSAQTTDERVNLVTPVLFARYPSPEDLAGADPDELEDIIHSTGFFRAKARALTGMAQALAREFSGAVPRTLDELVTLPGVGRKTANVVLSVAFGLPGLPVDTHVGRLARRLGLSSAEDPVVVEHDLCAIVPPAEWGAFSVRLILHGRNVCDARRPRCDACALVDVCPRVGVGCPTSASRPIRSSARRRGGS